MKGEGKANIFLEDSWGIRPGPSPDFAGHAGCPGTAVPLRGSLPQGRRAGPTRGAPTSSRRRRAGDFPETVCCHPPHPVRRALDVMVMDGL